MGTGWRRAFCTSIPRDPEEAATRDKLHRRQRQCSPTSSPASCAKFGGVFSGGRSNNTSPTRLRCRAPSTSTDAGADVANTHRCKNTSFAGPYTPPPPSSVGVKGSPRLLLTSSNPASPRSPFRFSLLKATLRLSRSRCGVCSQSVSTDQRTAVFTAECSHSFHFHCISAHFRSQSRSQSSCLTCPVCSASWHEVPLLSQANTLAVTPPPASRGKVSSDKPGEKELKQGKIYDDDEPLQISSTVHGGGVLHFNPIPEADLEDELEGGSNHVGGSSSQATGFGVEVSVMPEAAVVSYDRANSQYVVLVRVRAPSPPNRSVSKVAASLMDPSCRAPIDLVTVLDVSGSMTAAKLQMLKHAMRLLISSLGPADRLSIVAFSAGAKRLLPLVRMSRAGQRSARQIIERLIISGGGGEDGMCIGHALRKATKVLEDRRQRNPVATIMLLSNGHQKDQPFQDDTTDPPTRLPPSADSASATRFAHLEIPISCSADGGGGSGDELYPVENVFTKCVRGLVSLVLQDVHLQLTFPAGFVSSVYSYGGSIGGGEGCVGLAVLQGEGKSAISVSLGDFYAEEKRELLVELRMTHPQQQQPQGWMSYKCSYRDPITHELVLCQAATAAMPPLHSSLTPRTQELRNLFITTRALVESRRLVDLNDLDTAAHLLSTARSLLLQSNSPTSSRHHKFVASIDSRLAELHRRLRLQHHPPPRASRGEQLTPTSAWRAAEQLAKLAIMRKSMSRVGDLHGFENARF